MYWAEFIAYFLSLYNSFAATSKQIETSLPASKPTLFIDSIISSIASSLFDNVGANPPSSPTVVERFLLLINRILEKNLCYLRIQNTWLLVREFTD